MRRCAFLTLENPTGYVIDDELAYEPLRELGWSVESIPWSRTSGAWSAYDAVVIRSPWDYVKAADAFLDVLRDIERSGTALFNPLRLVRWNIRKTYLRDLAGRGVPVVPTVWRDRLGPNEWPRLFEELGATELVVKPVVGVNADGAYRLDERTAREQAASIEAYFRNCTVMAQPFVPTITAEGEFSLFYFNGEHSHTILKMPASGDFRVQEEHGGQIRAVTAEEGLRAAGDAAIASIGEAPLYARTDFVRTPDETGFWLMELELIEPSLYLRMDADAPWRFASALHERTTRPTVAG